MKTRNQFELAIEFNATGIPYYRPDDDADSHSWVDLLANPHAIDELPELVREPALKEAVALLNSSDSILQTVGCECWSQEFDNGTFNSGSYIATCMRDDFIGRSAADCFWIYVRMAKRLESEKEPAPTSVNMRLLLKPFHRHDTGREGWQMELWIDCIWSSAEQAKTLWAAWLKFMTVNLINASIEAEEQARSNQVTLAPESIQELTIHQS